MSPLRTSVALLAVSLLLSLTSVSASSFGGYNLPTDSGYEVSVDSADSSSHESQLPLLSAFTLMAEASYSSFTCAIGSYPSKATDSLTAIRDFQNALAAVLNITANEVLVLAIGAPFNFDLSKLPAGQVLPPAGQGNTTSAASEISLALVMAATSGVDFTAALVPSATDSRSSADLANTFANAYAEYYKSGTGPFTKSPLMKNVVQTSGTLAVTQSTVCTTNGVAGSCGTSSGGNTGGSSSSFVGSGFIAMIVLLGAAMLSV